MVEVGGEFVGGDAAFHVGAERDGVAAAHEVFHVLDVAEDVGDGGAADGGEEIGEEVDADDAVVGRAGTGGDGFDLGVGEVAFGVLLAGEEGAGVGVGGDFGPAGGMHDGPEGGFGEVGEVVDHGEVVDGGEEFTAVGGNVAAGLVAAGVASAINPGEGDDADAVEVEGAQVADGAEGGGTFEKEDNIERGGGGRGGGIGFPADHGGRGWCGGGGLRRGWGRCGGENTDEVGALPFVVDGDLAEGGEVGLVFGGVAPGAVNVFVALALDAGLDEEGGDGGADVGVAEGGEGDGGGMGAVEGVGGEGHVAAGFSEVGEVEVAVGPSEWHGGV